MLISDGSKGEKALQSDKPASIGKREVAEKGIKSAEASEEEKKRERMEEYRRELKGVVEELSKNQDHVPTFGKATAANLQPKTVEIVINSPH